MGGIMLQTEHDMAYYLSKAEEYPFLGRAVNGSATFAGRLDDLLRILITGIEGGEKLDQTFREFVGLTAILAECSPDGFDAVPSNRNANALRIYYSTAAFLACGAQGLVVGGFLLAIPPFNLIEAAGMGIGAYLTIVNAPDVFRGWKAKRNAPKVFGSVLEAAHALDDDIGRAFFLELFKDARPRFEETYCILSGEERKAVDGELHSYLAAGGIPGMDENHLNDYLTGLLAQESEAEGDA